MSFETAFTMDTSSIKFGPGTTSEIGFDIKSMGVKRAMVVVDPNLTDSETVAIAIKSLHQEDVDAVIFDDVRIEPTDVSLKRAIKFAVQGEFDGYVAIGGGSTMDTAKAANLYATYPADFLTYVNAPIGKGAPIPGALKPLIAVPTTAGTGSETTGVVIFDLLEMHVKTGIAHRALRPMMGIVDPNNTRSMPKLVAACSGLDVLCHALESLTALPYTQRLAPESPKFRPAYQGANPISHIWASKAIEMCSKYLVRASHDPEDEEARSQMILSASFAGIGFGNAGVSLPHGMSYPISGMVRDFIPEGYLVDHAIIPHGMAVVMSAPAVFRFTAPTNPELHLEAVRLMGVDISSAHPQDAGHMLSEAIIAIMKSIDIPNGLNALGYEPADIEHLVEGTLPQHRVTKLSPRPATAVELTQLFQESMQIW
ncbi:MAG: iron-containing alcohol dehydrogenase [Anaerolineaceae bacterium]|nr:iron-containing alcohol dehydrogenase [Anaerolineaceae bacterium]